MMTLGGFVFGRSARDLSLWQTLADGATSCVGA